jgi:hypothetical protein
MALQPESVTRVANGPPCTGFIAHPAIVSLIPKCDFGTRKPVHNELLTARLRWQKCR